MPNRYVVRFGMMRQVSEFGVKQDDVYPRGAQVIVRSPRGLEWGEVLCEATERTKDYLGGADPIGRIMREANADDERLRDELWRKEQDAFLIARELVEEHKLAMQLVDVEHLFGGEKLTFYYVSEARIDFRELVKAMAKRFNQRIELRQMGIRDEAKLLADYGDCGKPVCCNTHLREMPPVSMKMAKLQKATLDPAKISGRCGRLKCCLRYEYDTYEEHRKELPGLGKFVITRDGKGKVIGQEILARKVLVVYEDNRRVLLGESDIVTVVGSAQKTREERTDDADDRTE